MSGVPGGGAAGAKCARVGVLDCTGQRACDHSGIEVGVAGGLDCGAGNGTSAPRSAGGGNRGAGGSISTLFDTVRTESEGDVGGVWTFRRRARRLRHVCFSADSRLLVLRVFRVLSCRAEFMVGLFVVIPANPGAEGQLATRVRLPEDCGSDAAALAGNERISAKGGALMIEFSSLIAGIALLLLLMAAATKGWSASRQSEPRLVAR